MLVFDKHVHVKMQDPVFKLVFLDRALGTCEVPPCRRAIKAVFRRTEASTVRHLAHLTKRRPRVLKTCLHCAAVLRDEYHPSATTATAAAAAAAATAATAAAVPLVNSKPLGPSSSVEPSEQLEPSERGLLFTGPLEATVSAGCRPMTATTATAPLGGTAQDPILGVTGSALGYFQSRRMWVGRAEYGLELLAAARLCGFIAFSVRRHRWNRSLALLRARRTLAATMFNALARASAVRRTLRTVRALDELLLRAWAPMLLRRRRFLAVNDLAPLVAAPLRRLA